MTAHTWTPGDHVWIGEPSPTKTHWMIDAINRDTGHAKLISGQTGRRASGVPLESLTLHTPTIQEGAFKS